MASEGRVALLTAQARRWNARPRRSQPGLRDVDLTLLSSHAEYLNYLADRDDVSASAAFETIVRTHLAPPSANENRAYKERQHLVIAAAMLEILDQAAWRLGLNRSEVARQLIDKALVDDPMLRLAG